MIAVLSGLWTVLLLGAFFVPLGPLNAEPITGGRIRVIDADTIKMDGASPNVRLVNFNTPETRRAKCDAERKLGGKATRRLRDLIREGAALDLAFVACACQPGTEGTKSCNFGRRCGTLTVAGRDVGDILIAEKLAVPFVCGERRCPKTPKPWCPAIDG